jgi:ABC-type lipoprotein release transport system permease subunit
MNLLKLAWKNLWRSKRRTIITGISIGFGIFLAVTFTGTGDYFYTRMIDAGATMGFGHVTIEAKGYNASPTLDKRLNQTDAIRQQLVAMNEISATATRIMGQAMFASASKSVGGSFIAIDPAHENPEYNLMLKSIIEGEAFISASSRGVVIGSLMAEKLNLRLGKKIVYTTTDVHGEIIGDVARVSAIFKTGVDEVDGGLVLLPIDRVRQALGYQGDEATMITVIISDQRYSTATRDLLRSRLQQDNIEILSWQETQGDLAALITLDRSTNYLSQVLVGLVIAAGILNTLLMSVLERTREFGVMMAIGMTPKVLFRLIMMESVWLGLFGLIVGSLITAPWYYYLYTIGIDFSEMIGGDYTAGGVLIDPVMHIRLFTESALFILGGVFLLTVIAGLYPAWRAINTAPVESLKNI